MSAIIEFPPPVGKRSSRKSAENGTQRVNRRHTVPSTITPPLRNDIAGCVRAGRSLAQTAKEYQASQFVVVELWTRAEIKVLLGHIEDLQSRLNRLEKWAGRAA